jgi:hypothetical protein
MRSLVLALLMMPVSTFAAERAAGRMCLHEERVKITELNGRIEIAGRPPRVDSIFVRLPVSCKTGVRLVPKNHNQAIDWLDMGLPLDLKAALLEGKYASPFNTSNYGASVMDDLYQYFTEHWALADTSAACIAPMIQERMKPYETPCFDVLIDVLREKYLDGAGIDHKPSPYLMKP